MTLEDLSRRVDELEKKLDMLIQLLTPKPVDPIDPNAPVFIPYIAPVEPFKNPFEYVPPVVPPFEYVPPAVPPFEWKPPPSVDFGTLFPCEYRSDFPAEWRADDYPTVYHGLISRGYPCS